MNRAPEFKTQSRRLLAAPLAAGALAFLVGCGGGNELAPPIPVAEGTGLGAVVLNDVDLGATPLVESGLAGSEDRTLQQTGEAATFTGLLPVARLSRRNLAPDVGPCVIRVVDASDPSIVYVAGADFTVDFAAGVLTSIPDGMGNPLVPDGTAVLVDYCYFDATFSVNVGVTLATGDYVSLTFHNLPAGASGGHVTSTVSATPPFDGSFAFNLGANENLTILGSRSYRVVDDPAVNDASLVAVDLTNQLNPCIEGRVVAAIEDASTREPGTLVVDFDDPDCP